MLHDVGCQRVAELLLMFVMDISAPVGSEEPPKARAGLTLPSEIGPVVK